MEENKEVKEEQPEQQEVEFDKFSEYDVKPDYAKGGYADEEEINPEEYEVKPEEEQPKEEQSQPEPFSTVRYGDTDYRFESKEQLEAMARRGLELGQNESQIRNYAAIINAAETDPNLGRALSAILQQYQRTGTVPVQQPLPQNAPVEDPNKEPEQRDDEDYDDFEKRLAAWRENRINNMVEQRVMQVLNANRQQQIAAQTQQRNTQIVNYCYGDPDRLDVIARMQDPRYCAPQLMRMADNDGEMFMRVYDDIKRGMGKPPFYEAPTLMYQNQQQSAAPVQGQPQKSAPFSERAGAQSAPQTNASNRQSLPDFKQMSDDDFRAFKQSVMLGKFN